MRRELKTLAVLALTLWCGVVVGVQVQEDPMERRVLDIAKDLRCAVCQNQSVAESNAGLARDMRDIIREQLQTGKSDDEVRRYFVDRYGNYILMKPPVEGSGTILWAMPVLLAAVLAITAFVYLKHRRRASLPPPPTLSTADRARVERARKDVES